MNKFLFKKLTFDLLKYNVIFNRVKKSHYRTLKVTNLVELDANEDLAVYNAH